MKVGTIIYKNGAVSRWKNRRIEVVEHENGDMSLKFYIVDKECADGAACVHKSYRGKVRETSIHLSGIAMEALFYSWLEYKKDKAKRTEK